MTDTVGDPAKRADIDTTFICTAPGEPAAGLDGSQAIVSLYIPPGDKEALESVRAQLKDCFTAIFDNKRTHVWTKEELDAFCKEEDDQLCPNPDCCGGVDCASNTDCPNHEERCTHEDTYLNDRNQTVCRTCSEELGR